ncbi:MAG: hypothetical protein WDW38_007588 [Sanguina aurantia]
MPVVLHVDVDAYFVQCEALRDPRLLGRPVAVQQHQDIISVSHSARAAGVTKHMPPAQARRLLSKVGGEVVHVFSEAGMRISYRPYREMSAALMRLLKSLPSCAVVEKASIDEAFILCEVQLADSAHPLQQGARLAEDVRAAARSELGLVVSVGVAGNKLLAKLASRVAKPDGVHVVDGQALGKMLAETPVERLPGMGGKVADALRSIGISSIAQLQGISDTQLVAQLALRPATAARLVAWGRGDDEAVVVEQGPSKSMQVQMSLTPVPLPMPPSHSAQGVSAAGGGTVGMLMPLPTAGVEPRARLASLLRVMARDLLSRVLLDRHQENRWPHKLAAGVVTQMPQGPPANSRGSSKGCSFPPPSLIDAPSATSGHGGSDGRGQPRDRARSWDIRRP